LPKYLIIHLKRFKNSITTTEKNTLKVDFPLENLDLTDFVLNRKPIKTSFMDLEPHPTPSVLLLRFNPSPFMTFTALSTIMAKWVTAITTTSPCTRKKDGTYLTISKSALSLLNTLWPTRLTFCFINGNL